MEPHRWVRRHKAVSFAEDAVVYLEAHGDSVVELTDVIHAMGEAPGLQSGALCCICLPADAGDTGDVSLIPGSGKSPGVENGNPRQYS